MQRVFFGWAQVWRTKSREAEAIRRLAVDPHSPPEFRCNGVVRNMDAFYQAFDVDEDDEQLIFDLTGQAKVWGPLSVYANIMNLFDQQYIVARRPFGARPNAPRWAHVGLKATF